MNLGIPSPVSSNFSFSNVRKRIAQKTKFPHALGYNDTQASRAFILRIARWFPCPPRGFPP